VTRRISLGCALLAILVGACQQTLVLDDLGPDGGRSGTGGVGVGPTDASSGDAHCSASQSVPMLSFTSDVPQVLVALDRSSWMNETFGTANESQLNAAINALTSLAQTYEPSSGGRKDSAIIEFAFLDFPEDPNYCTAPAGCCSGEVTPTTYYQMFGTAENTCNSPNSGGSPVCIQSKNRPIAAALSKAHDYFSGLGPATHNNERYVLLVTDGDPAGGCSTNANDCMAAIEQIGNLSDLGVTTEVVAIGAGGDCLTELVSPGGSAPYAAPTADMLFPALQKVTDSMAQADCRLTLSPAPRSGQLTVVYGGTIEPEDDTNNSDTWSYGNDNTRVILHGKLCDSFLQNSQSSPFGLQIYDGCVSGQHFGQNP
jgi:hypothetical protein